MENQIAISVDELKRELESTVNLWVDRTFNFINVALIIVSKRITNDATIHFNAIHCRYNRYD